MLLGVRSSCNPSAMPSAIERPEQLARLRSLACDLGQGFLFARPLVREEIDEMLESKSNRLNVA